MTTITVSPQQQLQNISDALARTEWTLEEKGIPVYVLRTWLNQTMLLQRMQEAHGRGELKTLEVDQDEYD